MFTRMRCVAAVLVLVGVTGLVMGQAVTELSSERTSLAEPWVVTTDSGCLSAGGDAIGVREQPTVGPCEERDEIKYYIGNSGVKVVHYNATYNCCPDYFKVSIDIERGRILLIEKEILTHPCTCHCCYNISSSIFALPPGEYEVKYCWFDYEEGDEVCDVQRIVVPRPIVVQYGDNDCQDPASITPTPPVGPCEERDVITYEATERMLRVYHDNATYNCCRDEILVELDVDGHTLIFREQEIVPDPCRCVCCYDVWARVYGLESGEYRAVYCYYDYETFTEICDEQVIRIP